MPFHTLPGSDVRYGLIHFDKDGRERPDDPEGGVFSRTLLAHVTSTNPSHVFLFAHGWKGDVPRAIEQYDRWIGGMWALSDDRGALGEAFRPMFVGLHWPSQPWGEESIASPLAFGTASAGIEPWLEAAVDHFGGSRPGVPAEDVRQPLEMIFRAFEADPAARVLPPDVIAAYKDLGRAIGFSAGAESFDAPPDEDGAALDPQAAVRAERMASAGQSFGAAGSMRQGILAGLRQASFWLMKHRARTVGEQGMHQFVSDLQRACPAGVHLMGHSFGCIIVSSILAGPGGTGALPRAVSSAVLVQGALSHWSYASSIPNANRPGYFRQVIGRRAVAGPIVSTHSVHDKAVGIAYPAAVGLVNEFDFGTELPKFGAMGSFGIQGLDSAEALTLRDERSAYELKAGRVYNIDSSRYVLDHSAIDGPQVAHLLWQAAAVPAGPQT